MMALRPGVTYPNFGFHYLLQSIIRGVSNSGFFGSLFGDSSFIVTYMRYVGWNLNTVYQTGSNMGTDQKHDNPFLSNIGSGTMISDGLKMINMHDVATSFGLTSRRSATTTFWATHLLPAEWSHRNQRPVRHQDHGPDRRPGARERRAARLAGLRDSAQSRPRSRHERVVRRADASRPAAPEELVQFRHGLDLPRQPVGGSVCRVRARGKPAFASYDRFGIFAFFAASVALTAANMAFFIVLERASLGFKRLKPHLASIYDPYFWWHERYWKSNGFPDLDHVRRHPVRGMLLRAMGMKVGAKLFDCSLGIPERSLTEVGDYANLNEGCVLQAHSLEEGVFKSDYIRLGNRCSLGPGALVHYGVSTGDDVVLDADSFLMKGEILDSHTGWCGNPAKLVRRHVARAEVCVQDAADATVRNEFAGPQICGEGLQRNRVKLKKVTADNWEAVVELESVPARKSWWRATSIRLPRRSSIPTRARSPSMPGSASSAS